MENMLSYIFGTLKTTETAVDAINKKLKRQNGINGRTTMVVVAVTAWVCIIEMKREKEREELEAKLRTIDAEISLLKKVKGEAKM